MDQANLWTRRSNNKDKPSLSMRDLEGKDGSKGDSSRNFSGRRFGDSSSSHSKTNPFGALSPSTTKSPSGGASSAFGLGSGAFASFGSAKTPKTPGTGTGTGTAFDFSKKEKEKEKDKDGELVEATPTESASAPSAAIPAGEHALKSTWNLYYRPPANKFTDYEKSIIKIASIGTVEGFWSIYSHLKQPSALPTVSDYHIFKDGIRPVWEDDANKKGGKWIIRLKKGVSDRFWEDLLLTIVGDQFMEAGDEVCGAVLSVRQGEDVLNVWTKNDGGRNIKIRETIKRTLSLPADTNIIWKSHDESIAQRTAADEARQQKGTTEQKRRPTLYSEESKTKTTTG